MKATPDMVLRRAAFDWYNAEFAHGRVKSAHTDADVFAIAIPRVLAVRAGEVRWSEASPGDRRVWLGRPRNVSAVLDEHHMARWENLYDTLVGTAPGVHHMFGCQNVGYESLSNMQLAGQCAGAKLFTIEQMYADLSRPLDASDDVVVELIVGCKRTCANLIRDVVRGIPIGITVLERQNFSVSVSIHGLRTPLDIVMHLEGPVYRPSQFR